MPDQKVAVITGTSTGFGRLIAEKLADDGYRVFGTMRDPDGRNASAKRELTARGISIFEMDVTDDASVETAASAILAAAGHIDVLVNNAGTAHMGAIEGYTAASLTQQLATNVVGPIRVSRAFLPAMRERKSGLIVFVSSVVGRIVMPFTGVYTSSKWALEALAEALSYEVRSQGVDVAIVQPGAYATNIFNAVIGPDDPGRLVPYGPQVEQMTETIAAALSASARNPSEVADAILALANAAAGTRPLRTPLPAGNPAAGINAAIEPLQRAVIYEPTTASLRWERPARIGARRSTRERSRARACAARGTGRSSRLRTEARSRVPLRFRNRNSKRASRPAASRSGRFSRSSRACSGRDPLPSPHRARDRRRRRVLRPSISRRRRPGPRRCSR